MGKGTDDIVAKLGLSPVCADRFKELLAQNKGDIIFALSKLEEEMQAKRDELGKTRIQQLTAERKCDDARG